MTRRRREHGAIGAMCDRLVEALDEVYALSDAEMARYWGYMNSSTLTSIRKRKCLPDLLKIAKLVNEPPQSCVEEVINLNWLIAGRGPRFIKLNEEPTTAKPTREIKVRVNARKKKC